MHLQPARLASEADPVGNVEDLMRMASHAKPPPHRVPASPAKDGSTGLDLSLFS
jgi:hypothetical protein